MHSHGHGHGQCRHTQNQRVQSAHLLRESGADMTLNGYIDTNKFLAWNIDAPVADSLKVFDMSDLGNTRIEIQADADEEMLFYLPFTEFLRIRAICIVGGGSGTGPSVVKLYANAPQMRGFDSLARLQHSDMLELVDTSDDDELVYMLNQAKFMSVGNLTIFVEHSFSGEETRLRKIVLFGDSTNLPTTRPVVANVMYELRGNPADNKETEDDKRKKDGSHLVS